MPTAFGAVDRNLNSNTKTVTTLAKMELYKTSNFGRYITIHKMDYLLLDDIKVHSELSRYGPYKTSTFG